MSPAEALVGIAAVLGVFGAPVAIMYMWTHRPQKKELGASPSAAALEARLERIEVAVQAIALETERIAEGQRFTTKLLTAPTDQLSNRSTRLGA